MGSNPSKYKGTNKENQRHVLKSDHIYYLLNNADPDDEKKNNEQNKK